MATTLAHAAPSIAIKLVPVALSALPAIVFLDSLRFKFTDDPKTQVIFGKLDAWASTFGASGLFDHTGLFSQYAIGSAEVVAAGTLLLGITRKYRKLSAVGALIGLGVITGAIYFHLFTPLGTDPNNDGGGLFKSAVAVWFALVALLVIRRRELGALLRDLRSAFFG